MTWFRWWVEISLNSCAGDRISLGFVWVVEIDLISVWGIELDLISVWIAIALVFVRGRKRLGFSVWIEIHLVFVSGHRN